MIVTEKYKEIPATIVHRITGDITAEEAEWAVKAAVEIFEAEVEKCGNINVIINAQGVNFTSLIAHKTWRVGLRSGCEPLKERINYGIMVLDDVPNARAEKELMENGRLKFFFDLGEATKWLQDRIRT